MCVKLNLANKYGISPDVCPDNNYLWKQALNHNILFHEFYEYVTNELTNIFEHKVKSKQGKLTKIVVTDLNKINTMKQQRDKLANYHKRKKKYPLDRPLSKRSYNNILEAADRTTFTTNDLFGGKVKIVDRKFRKNSIIDKKKKKRKSINKEKDRDHRRSRKRKSQNIDISNNKNKNRGSSKNKKIIQNPLT